MIVKRKLFFAWNMDKEKKWLEEQAKLGCVLKDIKPFKYYFEKQEPQDLVYQFDFQILSKNKEEDYLALFEDWTFVARFGGWYYFYKLRKEDEWNQIYSDNQSKKSLFVRLIGFLAITGFPLYYQLLFLYPNMDPAKLTYPNFFFFFRPLVVALVVLHAYAMIRLLFIMVKYNKMIKE